VMNCAQARTHDPFAARDGSDYDSASSFNSSNSRAVHTFSCCPLEYGRIIRIKTPVAGTSVSDISAEALTFTVRNRITTLYVVHWNPQPAETLFLPGLSGLCYGARQGVLLLLATRSREVQWRRCPSTHILGRNH